MVSPLVGVNLMSVPRLPVEPAVAELGRQRHRHGVDRGQRAAGANAAIAPTTAAHRATRRNIAALCFPRIPEPNPFFGATSTELPQEFLMTMPSMMLAALSAASIAASRRSNRSFQRITTMGSIPPSNSEATASRVMRSPSFSRRLISTV